MGNKHWQTCEWHPKGNVVLAGSRDNSTWMWLAATGAYMNVFSGHSGPVTCGDFTPDGMSCLVHRFVHCMCLQLLSGKQIVTGSEDGTVRVWDPKTAATTTQLQGHGFHSDAIICMHINSANLMVTGSQVLCPSLIGRDANCLQDNTAKIANLSTGKVLGNLSKHTDFVEAVAFSSRYPSFSFTVTLIECNITQ
jgi:angio-associated migratory cell protein